MEILMTQVTINGKDYTANLSGPIVIEFADNSRLESRYLRYGTLHLTRTEEGRFPVGAVVEITAPDTPTLKFAVVTDTSTNAAPHSKDWGFSHTITFA